MKLDNMRNLRSSESPTRTKITHAGNHFCSSVIYKIYIDNDVNSKPRRRRLAEVTMESFIKKKAKEHRKTLERHDMKDKLDHFYLSYNKSLLIED